MPTTRQRAKGITREDLERELAVAIAEERAHTQAQVEARRKREQLEKQKQEFEEDERIRLEAERNLHLSQRDERLQRDAYADLAWERMDEGNMCRECAKRGADCYRAPLDPNDRRSPSVKKFRIGRLFYSTCQGCKVHRRACDITEPHPRVATPGPSLEKRKRESPTPPHDFNTPHREQKRRAVESYQRRTELPTPSPEFLEGSSTRPLVSSSAPRGAGEGTDRLEKIERELSALRGNITVVNGKFEQIEGKIGGVMDQMESQKDLLYKLVDYMRCPDHRGRSPAPNAVREEDGLEYTDEE
ncbi:hypothetical protein FA13DRAFT_1742439 [Coprinellus micaceus]|uniref:Uncharacterized protein n=1 Tax=Coprinellus micaceus TaxID=71717 RepID=A0A4Y7SGR6_COPMI|nr:hypothetical protein FA13DRAFT_1742439 [Coprinellus micaceus]